MEKKNKVRMIIIISVIILMLAIGGVYAWLTFTTGNVIVAGNTHCFTINYTKGADITGNIGAIYEEDYLTGSTIKLSTAMGFTPISMELDRRCNKVSGTGVLELNVSDLSTSFTSEGNSYGSLKYVVAEYDPTLYTDSTIQYLKNQTFTYIRRGIISEEGTMDIHTEYLSPGEKHDYLVIIYIDKNKAGDDIIGAGITATGTARAEQFVANPISDFEYSIGTFDNGIAEITIPSGKVLLTSYTGTSTTVNVPSEYVINGVSYTPIVYGDGPNDESTFRANTSITEVNFANGVLFADLNNEESLTFNSADRLFKGCTSLVNAPKLPNSITNLDSTFDGCTSLTNIEYVPTSTTSMLGTFKNCTNLEGYIRISNENVTVNSGTFNGTTKNIVVEVPANSVTYTNIDTIKPNNVELVYLGKLFTGTPYTDFIYALGSDQTQITQISSMFSDWSNPLVELDNVTLPATININSDDILLIRYIGEDTSVTVPATYMVNGIQYNTVILTYVDYSAGNSWYMTGAFNVHPTIEEVHLDEDVDVIGYSYDSSSFENGNMNWAFQRSNALTTVSVIPKAATNIGSAFDECDSLNGTIRFYFCNEEGFNLISPSSMFNSNNQIILEFPQDSYVDDNLETINSNWATNYPNISATIFESDICLAP